MLVHRELNLFLRAEPEFEWAAHVLKTVVSGTPSHLPFSTVAARYRCWSGLLWSLR